MVLRILYCQPSVELYGADRMAAVTVQGFESSGHEVSVVVPREGPLEERFARQGISTIIAAIPTLRKDGLTPRGFLSLVRSSAGGLSRALQVIRSADPDIVYVNTLTQPIWLVAAKLLGRPAVCHVRESEPGQSRLVRAGLIAPLRLADLVVANSNATRAFIESSQIFTSTDVRVIHNGKDWSPYFKSRPTRPSEKIQLLVVGRLSPRKGQDVAIRALGVLRHRGIDARLSIVGDVFPGYEWYEEELHSRAEELGVSEFVVYAGFRDDIVGDLAAADIVIVPSRQEPFGTVAAEALAAMRPVIVSAVDGLTEIIDHMSTGLVVPAEDEDALADAVIALVKDVDLALSLSECGYEFVLKEFSIEKYHERIEEVVKCLPARRPVRS
ncbi:glycosyltransferase family 4 protein [Rhodococcus oxybenzonivorans]|uniref:Glycosyltransferase family 4 protein n=2 Tax=Nocardiaceae TaxID=85025 RepID=A0AAE4V2R0_9NOCA|nr:glycosyltransferase family 4 protein [Rhodococcus oxybenzonivorans]MDV7267192.1 glycosyltransferase family 4 protein [Rhodococcus oxybenzonivorans]